MISSNSKSEKKPKRTTGILLDEKQWLYIQMKYNLSSRELQVAILLCRGFSNEEMAAALKIQPGTIKTHLRNLYRCFRVNNKVLLILTIIDDVIEKFYTPVQVDTGHRPIQEIPPKAASALPAKEKQHT